MGGMIQIRNVPPELHSKLKARAAKAGQSLSDYLLAEIRRFAEVPSREEIVERLRRLPRVDIGKSAAEVIRAGRREREEQLARVFRVSAGRSNKRRKPGRDEGKGWIADDFNAPLWLGVKPPRRARKRAAR